MGLTV
jgi:hypothetical protein